MTEWRWPNGARLAMSFVVNVEEGSEMSTAEGDKGPEPVDELGVMLKIPIRNYGNESNYRYGLKAGGARVLSVLKETGIRASFTAAALSLERAPGLAAEIVRQGHEVTSHGWRWVHQFSYDEMRERDFIDKAVASITKSIGTRPGMLKAGERDYRVAGTFLVTPDRRYNMLTGNVGFPPEQQRLMIPIEWNDPGWVVANEKPLLIPNTDKHVQFRQFLKSSRMGSSMYAPMFARVDGAIRFVGQMVAAAQARETYDESDLHRLQGIAAVAALAYALHDGGAWLAADYPAKDAWRADAHARLDKDQEGSNT